MIQKIAASSRFRSQFGWLDTYHFFSFANYYDPMNVNFGALRVFNDDTISPHHGFEDHGHDNMEIVTIMLEGVLMHTDSMGNKESIRAGEVQRMSAGTGVIHAEKNEDDEKVHLYQIWIVPDQQNTTPSYEQKDFSPQKGMEGLLPIVTKEGSDGSLTIGADAAIFLGQLASQKECSYDLRSGRGLFLYITTGSLTMNGIVFESGDQARIQNETRITMQGRESSSFIVIDVTLI